MGIDKYNESTVLAKEGRFVSLAPYGTLGIDGLSASSTTTSAGAEGRAVVAAKGAPEMSLGAGGGARGDHSTAMAHLFTSFAETLDLSSLTAASHSAPFFPQATDPLRPWPGLPHAASAAIGHPDPAWGLADDAAAVPVADHHHDHDKFTDHLAHHVHYEFG